MRRQFARGFLVLVVAAGIGLTVFGIIRHVDVPDPSTSSRDFTARWGVSVITSGLQSSIAPIVARPDRPVQLDDLSPEHAAKALEIISGALSVYPPDFVRRLLDRVVLADRILIWNKRAGGFFAHKLIAVSTEAIDTDEGKTFIADTVHHELSSLVRASVTFNVTQWEQSNPPGFTYIETHTAPQDVVLGQEPAGDAALHRLGFVNAYGQTTLDNDWNTYAAEIFGDGRGFADELKQFPAMRPKARILMDIYVGLAPALADYFTKTGLKQAANAD